MIDATPTNPRETKSETVDKIHDALQGPESVKLGRFGITLLADDPVVRVGFIDLGLDKDDTFDAEVHSFHTLSQGRNLAEEIFDQWIDDPLD